MPALSSFMPFLKVILVFICMLVGVRLKWGLGISALLGSLLLALLFGLTPWQWGGLALDIFTDRGILTVWAVVVLVLSLSSLMEQTKQAERFMGALSHRITSPKVRMVFFPMLIGLLPMPGGAVFSAPMINAVAKNLDVPEEDKSLINYWFRHTAEMSWPLFPALILAAGMAGMSTPSLGLWTMPLTAVFFVVGWVYYVRPLHVGDSGDAVHSPESGSWGNVLRQGAPIFVALGGALVLEAAFAWLLPALPMDDGVLVALVLGVLLCLRQNDLGVGAFLRTLRKPHVSSMIFMVGALGIFKNVLSGGGVVESLLVSGSGTATLWLSATLLPILAGMLTGMMIACVGSVFPLIVALGQSLNVPDLTPWLVLGLVSSFTGNMISPLHICFVLSCEYFKVNLTASWRRLPVPSLLVWVCGLGYFFCIR